MRALFAIALGGCTVGAPPGFARGDHWTWPLVGPLEDGAIVVAAPSEITAPRIVAATKLKRLIGDVPAAPAGAAVAIVKICLSPDGKVDTTKLVKSSGVASYDEQLQTVISSWSYEPQPDGKPVCTTETFLTKP